MKWFAELCFLSDLFFNRRTVHHSRPSVHVSGFVEVQLTSHKTVPTGPASILLHRKTRLPLPTRSNFLYGFNLFNSFPRSLRSNELRHGEIVITFVNSQLRFPHSSKKDPSGHAPTMRLLRQILLPLSITRWAFSQSQPEPSDLSVNKHDEFRELLEALPEQSIHAALQENLHPKYQDGVYQHDKSALEAVHSDNPPLATRLLAVAALDLIKRQNGTVPTSTSTTSSDTTTPNPPPSTSSTAVVVPVTISSTDSGGSVVVATSSAIAAASTSVAVRVTTTNSQGQTLTSTSTVPAAVVVSDGVTSLSPVPVYTPATTPSNGAYDVTTTDKSGNTVVLSNVHSGQALTTTDAKGSTFVTTFTPDGGVVSSLVLKTTTLSNGQKSTITSFAPATGGGATQTGPAGSSGSPHLQNGVLAQRRVGKQAIALMGGAVGVAILL